ncbi:DUF2892 domain-containing protein [Candidatus Kaiserbacteria bacterium]|nr:DUF2892 domain-containing protein [Candidatus Kaiserbacteria bacterium]
MSTQRISPEELKRRLSDNDHDEILIDVREPNEYSNGRIPAARNIPLEHIEAAVEKLKDIGTVYVHCASGNRSARACELLFEHGVNVVNVDGGINAWRAAGLEVVGTGKRALPMMRQVLLIAGALILIGMALGTWINPWWYLLSAAMGGGLFFAGATGYCGMTYILKYLPWNR